MATYKFKELKWAELVLLNAVGQYQRWPHMAVCLRKNARLMNEAVSDIQKTADEDPGLKKLSDGHEKIGGEFKKKFEDLKKTLNLGKKRVADLTEEEKAAINEIQADHNEAIKKFNDDNKESIDRNQKILDMDVEFKPYRIKLDRLPHVIVDVPGEDPKIQKPGTVPLFDVLINFDIIDFQEQEIAEA